MAAADPILQTAEGISATGVVQRQTERFYQGVFFNPLSPQIIEVKRSRNKRSAFDDIFKENGVAGHSETRRSSQDAADLILWTMLLGAL